MTLDDLTTGQAKSLATMFAGATPNDSTIGKIGRKVIVRSRDAGVIYGEYAGNKGSTIHVKNARQLWKWQAKKGLTLIDVAIHGVTASGCKFSPASADLTVFNACALIDVSADAAALIEAV